jgi:diguanylate cyclase (GGDEF)-like protein
MAFPVLVQPNWKQERRIFRNRVIQFALFVVLQLLGLYSFPGWAFGVIIAFGIFVTVSNAWGIRAQWHLLPTLNLFVDQAFTIFLLSTSGAGSGPFVFVIYLHVLGAIIFTGQRSTIIVVSVVQTLVLTLATFLSQYTATPGSWQAIAFNAVGLLVINLFGIRPAEDLHSDAQTDPLTGTLNRRSGFARLEQWLNAEQDFNVLVIDMKRFKTINDTYGHSVGDEVLQAVAQRLRGSVREDDLVIRQGGDEFLIATTSFVTPILERLDVSLKQPVRTSAGALEVLIDIGVAQFPKDANDLETLIAVADEKMYAAKAGVTG